MEVFGYGIDEKLANNVFYVVMRQALHLPPAGYIGDFVCSEELGPQDASFLADKDIIEEEFDEFMAQPFADEEILIKVKTRLAWLKRKFWFQLLFGRFGEQLWLTVSILITGRLVSHIAWHFIMLSLLDIWVLGWCVYTPILITYDDGTARYHGRSYYLELANNAKLAHELVARQLRRPSDATVADQ